MNKLEQRLQGVFAAYNRGAIDDEEYDEKVRQITEARDRERIKEIRASKAARSERRQER